MRARRAVQKHGLRVGNHHVERADFGLVVLERNVAAVHAAGHGHACLVRGGLRDGVVAVAELELDHVANRGSERVGDEGVLGSADDDGNHLVLTAGEAVRAGADVGAGDGEGGGGQEGGEDEGLHGCLIWLVVR